MTKQTLKFKPVVKDRLFYDRYQYSISFHLDEATCLRELDHSQIDAAIKRRIHYRQISQERWIKNQNPLGTLMPGRWKNITESTVENLHKVTDMLLNSAADCKLVTSVNTGWIYTNDQLLIKEIDQLSFLKHKRYTEAIVDRPKNTIKLKNPRYTHRSYIKSAKLANIEKTQLVNFFNNQIGYIRISPAFVTWLNGSFYRTQDYFFIEHNGESWLLMLSLVKPGLVRKTMGLITA